MAAKFDEMQNYSDEITIPEGKVENMVSQWLVHEDSGLAYKLQEEEIEDHLNHNKIRNQIVRSDLLQAKHIQQSEQQIYEQRRQLRQAQLDEQLAKELQLNLIEEEQMQMLEQQRIADEDEKFAKSLHEKEKQKMMRRKLAREKAQIENIKRERLQYYLDNNLDITSTMNDDLDELDLSDFCMRPPDQLRGDQLQMFMTEQDEELARFLQIYENQKKTSLIKDKQELQENQDYEIARLIYEEEKAKLRRLKEKRLQKQRMKQLTRQDLNSSNADSSSSSHQQQEYYIPDNRFFRLPNHSTQSSIVEQNTDQTQSAYANEEQSLYDEPPLEDRSTVGENSFEETNFKQLADTDRPNSSDSSNSHHQQTQVQQKSNRASVINQNATQIKNNQLRYNATNQINEDNAQYTLSTKQANHSSNHVSNVSNFVKRALPPLPNTSITVTCSTITNNVICEIDPTYNKSKKDKSNENSGINNISNDSNSKQQTENSGLHFAQLARVDDQLNTTSSDLNEYDLVEPNCSFSNIRDTNTSSMSANQTMTKMVINDQTENGQNFYIQHHQLNNQYMPVQGQKRSTQMLANQKKTRKEKSKDKCRQQ